MESQSARDIESISNLSGILPDNFNSLGLMLIHQSWGGETFGSPTLIFIVCNVNIIINHLMNSNTDRIA